jgi:lipopolysaccharide biosynthesis glycosyltransferase
LTSPIHIALTFNDAFWAPAYAVMRSACLSSRRRGEIVFHLCHDGLSDEHANVLRTITSEFGAQLVFHPLRGNERFSDISRGLPVARRFPPVIYARLLLDVLMPADTKRVIYIDCDTMLLGDVAELYAVDLTGKSLAAVKDGWALFNKNGRDAREKRDVFDPASDYFNSGMMVIDLQRFAAADIPGRLARLRSDGVLDKLYFDQDMLNLIFAEDWVGLDWRWNVIDPRMAHQALHPKLLHFTGEQRPWSLFAGMFKTVAFGRLYRHVMTNEVFYRFWRERQVRRLRKLWPFGVRR